MMEALTPASAASLPPLGELVADEPSWHYPAGTACREGVADLRVWTTTTDPAGHLAAVTETGRGALVTQSAGQIRAELGRRYGPSLVLLEHCLAPEDEEGVETLDLIRIGADGSPHWSRVWPTPEDVCSQSAQCTGPYLWKAQGPGHNDSISVTGTVGGVFERSRAGVDRFVHRESP